MGMSSVLGYTVCQLNPATHAVAVARAITIVSVLRLLAQKSRTETVS